MTWEELKRKYPEYRDEMSEEREREFVKDCFDCYEAEGIAKKFWSSGGDYRQYHGEPFEVVRRAPEYPKADDPHAADLECLPMWVIRFADGKEISAYPDEIIPREMRDNGCRLEGIA